VRLFSNITRNGTLSDTYQQAADFSHYVKRDQKVGEKGSHSCLSLDRLFLVFAAYLDVIRIESVEDIEILLEVSANVRPEEGCIQGPFPSLATFILIKNSVIANDHALFGVHRNSSQIRMWITHSVLNEPRALCQLA
jgi:hypothetical protein